MYLALRELKATRGRFVLVAIVIALVALLTTLLSGLATGLVDDGISGLRALPFTHLALQPGSEKVFSRSTLTGRNLAPWRLAPGVEASPIGVSFFNAKSGENKSVDMALFGVEPGTFLAPRQDAQSALSGRPGLTLSNEFRTEGIKVGDELTIVGVDRKLPVVGFTYGGSYGHVPIAFTSLETWQELLYGDNANGRFSAIALKADDDASLAAVDKTAETETVTKEAAYDGSPGFAAETSTMDLIRFFLLMISALIVGAFFTVWTVQRTRQIGLLKALGATSGYVVRDALGQLAIILIGATVVGTLVAVGLGSLVGSDAPFSLQVGPVVSSAVILATLGMAGSLVALRKITSVDPIIALGAEG